MFFGINVAPHIAKAWWHQGIKTISTMCCKKSQSMMGIIKEKCLTSSSITWKFVRKKYYITKSYSKIKK